MDRINKLGKFVSADSAVTYSSSSTLQTAENLMRVVLFLLFIILLGH